MSQQRDIQQVLTAAKDGRLPSNVAIRELADIFIGLGASRDAAFERANEMLGIEAPTSSGVSNFNLGGAEQPDDGPVQTPGKLASPLTQGTDFTAADVERDFKAGVVGTDEEYIAILQALGIAQPEAVLRNWRGGGTGTIVGPGQARVAANLNRPGETIDDVADRLAEPGRVTELGADNRQSRTDLQRFQSEEDQFRRLRAGAFGTNLTPSGTRAADFALSQFRQTDPITSFANFGSQEAGATPISERFGAFQAGRPTEEQLTAGLQGFQGAGPENAEFLRLFGGDPRAAFRASIQPALTGVNPRFRGQISQILRDQFATRNAQTPDLFNTPEQILGLLTGFQGF